MGKLIFHCQNLLYKSIFSLSDIWGREDPNIQYKLVFTHFIIGFSDVVETQWLR